MEADTAAPLHADIFSLHRAGSGFGKWAMILLPIIGEIGSQKLPLNSDGSRSIGLVEGASDWDVTRTVKGDGHEVHGVVSQLKISATESQSSSSLPRGYFSTHAFTRILPPSRTLGAGWKM